MHFFLLEKHVILSIISLYHNSSFQTWMEERFDIIMRAVEGQTKDGCLVMFIV